MRSSVGADGSFTYTPTAATRLRAGLTPATDTFTVTVGDGQDSVDVTLSVPISATQLSETGSTPVGTGPSGVALSPDGTRAYVTNKAGNTVSVVNTATNAVISTITVGAGPSAVAIKPDGSLLYVTNRTAGTVSVINTTSMAVVATVKVGTNPEAVAVSPDGTRVFVTNAGAGTVSKIDTATNKVTVTIKVGNGPSSIAISPDAKYAYVTNKTDGTVSAITLSYNAVKTVAGVGTSPTGVIVSPDSTTAYVTNLDGTVAFINTATNTVAAHLNTGAPANGAVLSSDGALLLVAGTNDTVTAIDTRTRSIIQTLQTDVTPESGIPALALSSDGVHVYLTDSADNVLRTLTFAAVAQTPNTVVATIPAGQDSPQWIAFNATGTRGYVVNQGNGTVSVIDTATGAVTATITAGSQPTNAALGPNGNIYVSNQGDGSVTVIDPGSNTVIATIPVGGQPIGFAFGPAGLGYVTGGGGDMVAIINLATNTVVGTIPLAGHPAGAAVSPNGAYLYVTNQFGNSLSVISTVTNEVVTTIPMGINPTVVKFNNTGTLAYVTNEFSNQVYVIDTATNTVTTTIPVGTTPIDIHLNADNTRAYVTNFSGLAANDLHQGSVSVIDLTTNAYTVIANIPVGVGPVGAAISPDGTHLYVVNSGGSVSIIALEPTSPNAAPGNANIVVGEPDSSTGVVTGSVSATDPDGDTLTYTLSTPPAHGSVTVAPGGTFTYTPTDQARHVAADTTVPGASADAFTVAITDGRGGVTTALVNVDIGPQNAAPAFSSASATIDPATGIATGSVVFTDGDGDTLTYGGTADSAKGHLTVNPDGTFTYTPTEAARHAAAADGADSDDLVDNFTITVNDAHGATPTTNLALTVTPQNNAPVVGSGSGVTSLDLWASNIVFSADSHHAYTTVYDDGTGTSSFAIIDTATNAVTTIALPRETYSFVVTPDGSHAYVITRTPEDNSYSLTAIDIANGTATETGIPTYANPSIFAVSPDSSRVYVSSLDSATGYSLHLIDTATNAAISVPLSSFVYPANFAVSPDSSAAYFTTFDGTNNHYTFSAVDSDTGAVTSVDWPGLPHNFTLSADGSHAYATSVSSAGVSHALSVIDTATMTLREIPISSDSSALVVSLDNRYVYATTANALTIVDTTTNTVTDIPLGGASGYVLAVTPEGKNAYTTVADGSYPDFTYSLAMVNITTSTVTTVPLAGSPFNIVVSPDGSFAWVDSHTYDAATDSSSVLIIDTATNTTTSVPVPGGAFVVAISPDSQHVYAGLVNLSGGTAVNSVTSIDPVTGATTTVAQWTGYATSDWFAFSPDRQHFYATTYPDAGSPNILAVSLPPTGAPVIVHAPDPTTGVVTGALNAVDADGDTLSYTVTDEPSNGSVTFNADGTFSYTPSGPSHTATTDTFTVTVTDGHGGATPISVSVPVTPTTIGNDEIAFSLYKRPLDVAITPDGTRAYVISYGQNSLDVIDTNPFSPSYNTVTPLVDLYAIFVTPNRLAISPDGKRAYITTAFLEYEYDPVTEQLVPHYKVLVIDTDPASATYNTITARVDVGQGPSSGVAFSPDGKRTYVTIADSAVGGYVAVIDSDPESAQYNTVVGHINMETSPLAVAFSPDGKRAYVANQYGPVAVIDTDPSSAQYNTVIATIEDVTGSSAVAVSPNGKLAYAANESLLSAIDLDPTSANYESVIATVDVYNPLAPLGAGLRDIAFSPDGSLAFISNTLGSALVIDADPASSHFNTVVANPPTGDGGVAFTPDGTRVYQTISLGNDLNLPFTGSVSVLAVASMNNPPV